jgi:hypothetical protein
MDNILKGYEDAVQVIKNASILTIKIKEKSYKETSKIESEGKDAVRKIEREYQRKVFDVEEKANKELSKLTADILEHQEHKKIVLRYFNLMDQVKTGGFKVKPEVYVYSKQSPQGTYLSNPRKVYYEHVGIVRQNKLNDIRLYIVENGNSINSFSLLVCGSSFFSDEVRDRAASNGYINSCHDNCNIRCVVKAASNKEDLLKYIERPQNLKRIQAMLPANLESLEAEYEIVQELLKDKDWQIAYLQYKAHDYENNYSGGTSLPEYAQIQVDLKKLMKK